MLERLRHFLSLIRFGHTVFAMPFALLAAVLAWREVPFRWEHLAGLVLCMVFARSAAMAFNRLVDRRLDGENPRTAGRHLPAGVLSVPAVTAFVVCSSMGFVASTLLFWPNRWPVVLAVPVLLFLLGYSYAKRFTSLCHYWLGAALMLSPIAAWIALTGTLAWPPVLLAAAVFFWVGGFDVLYACQDVDFDRERGLFSLPARLGIGRALRLAMLGHLAVVACLVGLWWVSALGSVFLAGVIAVAALLVYEHALVRPDDLSRVNTAFFHVNAIIGLGLFAAGCLDVWLNRAV